MAGTSSSGPNLTSPAISLSVGVAFSEEGFVDSLVEQADSALYKVKKGGRCNCSFYEEIES